MAKGRIYILRSPYHQDALVKIGRTSRISEERAEELSGASGVPAKFEVLYEEEVHDAPLAERLIHEQLKPYRVNNRREFFQLPLKLAIRSVFSTAIRLHKVETGEAESRLLIRAERRPPDDIPKKLFMLLKPFKGGDCRVFVHFVMGEAQALLFLGDDWRVTLNPQLLSKIKKADRSFTFAWHIGPRNEQFEEVPF